MVIQGHARPKGRVLKGRGMQGVRDPDFIIEFKDHLNKNIFH